MKIATFDPGKVTSYALYDTRHPQLIEIGEVDLIGVGRLIRPCGFHIKDIIKDVDTALVEEVGARPGQGTSSMFTFGMCLGAIMNSICSTEVQMETVTPSEWKRSTRIHSKSDDKVKTLARLYAKQLFPQHQKILNIKKNHGQAEAILMARWYFLKGPGRDAADDDAKSVIGPEMRPDLLQ